MTTFVALLRGINVGGHKRMKMADLKHTLENLGMIRVRTYIQSGNSVFKSEENKDVLRRKIEQEIKAVFGFDVPVILRTADEFEKVIENCPFHNQLSLSVGFFAEEPSREAIDGLLSSNIGNDKVYINSMEVYVIYQEDISKTLLTTNFLENKLKTHITVRNWNTVKKLSSMAKEEV